LKKLDDRAMQIVGLALLSQGEPEDINYAFEWCCFLVGISDWLISLMMSYTLS
jgi:hypothetical protein